MTRLRKPKRCSTGSSARSTSRSMQSSSIDRLGREVVRNAAARKFEGARHGDVLAEDALAELLQQAIAGRVAARELQLYGPPRQVLQLRAFPLHAEGEVIGAVAFTHDVTEGRRVESVRRDFVANVSHELKTPIGALGLLAETMAAADDPAVVQQLAQRVRAGSRPPRADRRRPPRPVNDRGPGSADPRAAAGRAARSPNRSTSCRPRPKSPACRCGCSRARPRSRSHAITASCAARS